MILKGLVREKEEFEIEGRAENIQTITLLRSVRILKRVLDTRGDLLSLELKWNTTSQRWCEKFSGSEIIIMLCNNDNNNNNIGKYIDKYPRHLSGSPEFDSSLGCSIHFSQDEK